MPTRHFNLMYLVMCFLAMMSAADLAHAAGNPVITQTSIPNPTQFTAYSTTLNATGGTGNYNWSISAGTLPAGLSLGTCLGTTSCTISGTPTVSGAYNFTVQAQDSTPPNKRGTQQFTGTINPSCQLSGTTQGLYFGVLNGPNGDINPSTSPPISSTVTTPVTFQCGTGLTYAISVPITGPSLQMTGNNLIKFTIGLAAGGSGSDSMPLTQLMANNASTIDNFSKNFNAGTSSIGPVTVRLSWNSGANYIDSTLNVIPVNIMDTCSTPVNGSITFTINPASAGPLTPNTTADGVPPTVMCTSGQPHGVSCTSSHSYMLTIGNDGSTDPIAYTVTGCPASVTGSGFLTATPINFGLSLSATGLNGYQDAVVGAHSDTITVQVSY